MPKKRNYKPERAIDKLDIVGINDPGSREKLMKSLEKGNRHKVTALKNGKEVKLYLEANPAEHRVSLTNRKGEAQQLEHYKKPEAKQHRKKNGNPKPGNFKKKSKEKNDRLRWNHSALTNSRKSSANSLKMSNGSNCYCSTCSHNRRKMRF